MMRSEFSSSLIHVLVYTTITIKTFEYNNVLDISQTGCSELTVDETVNKIGSEFIWFEIAIS
jgi:hypothetical protein